MLIKLLKYDIKSTAKLFLLMSAVMLGLSLTAFLGGRLQNMIVLGIIVTVAALVSIAYICAYFVICGLHFYKQMTGRESYLMHTLPVKPHMLVLSKYLSTLFWGIFTTAVLCAFWFGAAEFLLFKPFSYSLYVMFHDEAVSGSIIIYLFAVIAAQYFLYLIPMTGFFICLINVPTLKNKNRGLAAAIIGWISMGQIIGIIQVAAVFLVLWLEGSLSGLLNNDVQAAEPFIRYLCHIMLSTSVLFGGLFYAGASWLTSKHRSI